MKKAIVMTLGVIIGVTGVLAICAHLADAAKLALYVPEDEDDYQPLIGRVHFINGDAQQFTDAKAYLDCIREELPHEATTGFRFRTITQDPAVRKAVDDIVFDLYGEENPCREEDYNLAPSEEMQMGGM